MSKISTCEKFFIGRIAFGLKNNEYDMNQEDIQRLLSEGMRRDESFNLKIKNALINAYTSDMYEYKKGSITSDPSHSWEESVIKLYKGRETLMRDIVIEWYSKLKTPSFWDMLKNMFKK